MLEQIAVNARPKIEEHMLIVKDKITDEEKLSQPLQTNIKLFKSDVTLLSQFYGILYVENKKNKFFSTDQLKMMISQKLPFRYVLIKLKA